MDFDNDFFIQAQGILERTVRANKQKLFEMHGNIESVAKSNNTLVTDMDKSIERELTDALLAFDSSIGIHGEEFGQQGSTETFWLIDPIDGTDGFIRGMSYFRNMITLIDRGEPVFTFVYKPITDELYVAAKGDGTYKNGKKIEMQKRPLERALIEFTGPMDQPGVPEILQAMYSKIWNFKMGDWVQVPEGKLDGHLVFNGRGDVWDYAPRALLISEAGGKVANIGSDKYDYTNLSFLAAHPSIFDELMDTVIDSLKS